MTMNKMKRYRAFARREMVIELPDGMSDGEVCDEITARLFSDGDWSQEFEYSEMTQEEN